MAGTRAARGEPNIKEDARRVYEVLKSGGIAVMPASMGYTIATTSAEALNKIFTTKKRGAHKRHAMGGTYALHKEVHVMTPEMEDILHWLTMESGLPVACIAKYNPEHPLIKSLDPVTLEAATHEGTVAMLINGGKLQDEVISLCAADNLPVLGSSANISTTGNPSKPILDPKLINFAGTKYALEDVPQELIDIADIVIDYGIVPWGHHGRSSTMINFSGPKIEIVRIGLGYDIIKDHLARFWGITDLPEDPGREALPHGHLKVLEPLESLKKLVAA